MAEQKVALPFEEAAEHRTGISGWVCKTCRSFYGEDERAAKWCCAASIACSDCGGRNNEKSYIYCEACREKRRIKAWEGLPTAEWDGETPLVLDDDDKYFFDPDAIVDYLEEHNLKIEDLQLVICVPEDKPRFDMYDVTSDYFAGDMDNDLDYSEINKKVNGWIEENLPAVWVPGKTRPTLESLREGTTFQKSEE